MLVKKERKILVALAGQPNSGKSTIFNMLTGVHQHVANYPGVTVEKKSGFFVENNIKVELVDLPGTYSLTSYSIEERISRDFLLQEKPNLVLNIIDASNLRRNLYLTLQLLEMNVPLVIDLNMIDVAKRQGIIIDIEKLSSQLGVPVIPTIANKGKGKKELKKIIIKAYKQQNKAFKINYGIVEPIINSLEEKLSKNPILSANYPLRWLAVKLIEDDPEAKKILQQNFDNLEEIYKFIEQKKEEFLNAEGESIDNFIAYRRYQVAEEIVKASTLEEKKGLTLSDKIDKIACNRIIGPLILVGIIYLLYELSIVEGYKITSYTWPLLAGFREIVTSVLPHSGFIDEPFLRSLSLWVVNGVIAVLNYVPIFLILFSLIAILEDTGYMARMAFILDRIFRPFGLHGQCTLPWILGGVYVGGCAIPGVMACRAIKDERVRMATILTVPLMNCMAKIPLYILLTNIYFQKYKGVVMFFIATITVIIALGVAKLLNITVLKTKESAPFLLEMPSYHLPTFQSVIGRSIQRTWLFVKKVITIVIAISIVVYILISFPSLSIERDIYYQKKAEEAITAFFMKIKNTSYANAFERKQIMEFIRFWEDYKKAKIKVKNKETRKKIDEKFKEINPRFFKIVKPKDKEARKVNKAFKKLISIRKKLLREKREERIRKSFLGRFGRLLEPLTQFAGFNWRINIALLSSFAAKESSVATLGAIYQSTEKITLEEKMKEKEKGFTPLHALAIMVFMAMYPPCIPTLMMVKLETGLLRWMLFAAIYPTIMGISFAILIFSGGRLLGLSGIEAMIAFYILALAFTITMAFIKRKSDTL